MINFLTFSLKIINQVLMLKMMKNSYLMNSQSSLKRDGVKTVKNLTLRFFLRKKQKNSQVMLFRNGKDMISLMIRKNKQKKLKISYLKVKYSKKLGKNSIAPTSKPEALIWWRLMSSSDQSFHKPITYNLIS